MDKWLIQALLKVEKAQELHRVERAELMDRELVCFTDSKRELVLSDKGIKTLNMAFSPDYASKRF